MFHLLSGTGSDRYPIGKYQLYEIFKPSVSDGCDNYFLLIYHINYFLVNPSFSLHFNCIFVTFVFKNASQLVHCIICKNKYSTNALQLTQNIFRNVVGYAAARVIYPLLGCIAAQVMYGNMWLAVQPLEGSILCLVV